MDAFTGAMNVRSLPYFPGRRSDDALALALAVAGGVSSSRASPRALSVSAIDVACGVQRVAATSR